jgi:AraC-like DNA-binding protein
LELEGDVRASDSPLVEMVWHTWSNKPTDFMSVAATNWEMVFSRVKGEMSIAVRGPETIASMAQAPDDAEFFGIVFKLGTFMPQLPARNLVDNMVSLPFAAGRSFWLHGSAWHVPDYENADSFVEMLVRRDLLVKEPVVEDALNGQIPDLSLRSVQRRFVNATGITHGTVLQIQRARKAAVLLEQGISILDTVEMAGYADQPHLTRSLRRFFGKTPVQIAAGVMRSP